jgi:DNA polymerase III subunit epsilon
MSAASIPATSAIFTGLDFEGSGSSSTHADSPVQIGMATLSGQQITTHTVSFLCIDHEVTREAYRVHRIDRALCVNAPSLHSFWPQIKDCAARTVFASHNAATERRYLKNAFPLLNVHSLAWVDTLKLSRIAWPHAKSHQLEALVGDLGLAPTLESLFPGRSWHDALFDAAGSLMILRHLLALPDWQNLSLHELQQAHPKAWHQTQVATRRKVLRPL